MKVQITVDDELWRLAKSEAALRDITLGQLVNLGIATVCQSSPSGTVQAMANESVITTGDLVKPTPERIKQ